MNNNFDNLFTVEEPSEDSCITLPINNKDLKFSLSNMWRIKALCKDLKKGVGERFDISYDVIRIDRRGVAIFNITVEYEKPSDATLFWMKFNSLDRQLLNHFVR